MRIVTNYTIKIAVLIFVLFFSVQSFALNKKKKPKNKSKNAVQLTKRDSVSRKVIPFDIETNSLNSNTNTDLDGLLWFAKQQLGIPYKYASADPKNGGLDCSGFLYYVFGHFKIKVPRSSKDYMNYGKTININDVQKGDVLIFTGSDATQKVGGHVGLVVENNNGDITFIHGSSGKGKGVMISNLSEAYYTKRFLKAVRVL